MRTRGVVLQGLHEQKIQHETFPRAGRPEHERVADVAVKQVVVKRRVPLRFQNGERRPVQVPAARLAARRAVDRRQARRHAGRHKHGADLPLARLRRQAAKPRGELAVAFADRFRVVRGKDAEKIAVQPFGVGQVAVQGDGEREVAVGDAFGFEFHQGLAQAAGFHLGRAIDHRRRGAFGLLHVRHQRVPL